MGASDVLREWSVHISSNALILWMYLVFITGLVFALLSTVLMEVGSPTETQLQTIETASLVMMFFGLAMGVRLDVLLAILARRGYKRYMNSGGEVA